MGYFVATLRALATTFGGIFGEPSTVEFPIVIRPRAERFRASFAIPDDENGEAACVACLACEKICPSQVIRMKSGGKRESPVTGKKRAYVDEFVLDMSACIQCELCVQVCNSDAIIMVREPEIPSYSREDLVLDYEKLRANAKKKTASWGRGSYLLESQEAKPKAEKKPAPAKAVEAPKVEAAPAAEAPKVEAPKTTEPVAAAATSTDGAPT
jgi:NADH-quinone oxidoreductase subunit I